LTSGFSGGAPIAPLLLPGAPAAGGAGQKVILAVDDEASEVGTSARNSVFAFGFVVALDAIYALIAGTIK
jgi:hypothetical protein